MRPSGARDADIVVRALEEYKQKDGREKFSNEHVWAIVKDLPSWQPQFVARQISLNTSSTNQTSSGSVAGTASGSEEVFPRLMGKKAPKQKAKEHYSNNDDDDDDIHVSLDKQRELLERYQKLKMERDERKMKWKEYKVLTRNTAGMTKEQLALHEEYFCPAPSFCFSASLPLGPLLRNRRPPAIIDETTTGRLSPPRLRLRPSPTASPLPSLCFSASPLILRNRRPADSPLRDSPSSLHPPPAAEPAPPPLRLRPPPANQHRDPRR
nr:uncharacterized protein LOC109179053 [Ipomoea trifida]